MPFSKFSKKNETDSPVPRQSKKNNIDSLVQGAQNIKGSKKRYLILIDCALKFWYGLFENIY